MTLYFENKFGSRFAIDYPSSREEAWGIIRRFLDKYNYKIPYVREWDDEEGLHWYDVGSHSEFFILEGDKNE